LRGGKSRGSGRRWREPDLGKGRIGSEPKGGFRPKKGKVRDFKDGDKIQEMEVTSKEVSKEENAYLTKRTQ